MTPEYPELTPAQCRVLDAMSSASAPIVVEDARRYTLAGELQHYKTIEALLRRGVLIARGNTLVLAETPADGTTDGDKAPVEVAEVETGRPEVGDAETPNPVELARKMTSPDTRPSREKNQNRVGVSSKEKEADPVLVLPADPNPVLLARRYAEMRRDEDAGRTDAGARARAALLKRPPEPERLDITEAEPDRRARPSRDESIFGAVWRALRMALS